MLRGRLQQTTACPDIHDQHKVNQNISFDSPLITTAQNNKSGGVTKAVHRRHHGRRSHGRCWALCDMRDIIWIMLFVCAGGSGFSAGVFYLFIQHHEHTAVASRRTSSIVRVASRSSRNHYSEDESRLGTQFASINVPLNVTQSRASATSIFYNVYLGSNTFGFSDAGPRSIIREQLGQVMRSFDSNTSATVYYTTIGTYNNNVVDVCRSLALDCRHLQHFPVASESATLSRLHEYCNKFPSHSVIYLHNKGSLHQSRSQDSWRQALTASALSIDCRQRSLRSPFKCNVCGLLFQPLPASHFPGNMWSATCEYIQQLLPPSSYHVKRPAIDEWIRREGNTFLFRPESHFVGKKRYEAEHWIGSHPSLQPCDVSITPSLEAWTKQTTAGAGMKLQQAPRSSLQDPRWIFYNYTYRNETLNDPEIRFRDYFLLRGMIYRWMVFYDRVADQESWVWSWYPDGSVWRNAILTSEDPMRVVQSMANSTGTASVTMPKPSMAQNILQVGIAALDWMQVRSGGNGIVYHPF